MFVSSVIDQETGIEYAIDTDQFPLGEGATAKVWQGINRQNPPVLVAVKIAHRGTPAALLEEFWGELSTLSILSKTEAKQNVPWAHRGESAEAPDANIIIMELIPDDWQLTHHALQADGRLPEKLALAAGVQYAQLLVALHSKNITTRGDRKATDLRWDSDQQRLIVLDWNRAKPIPTTKSGDEVKTSSVREEFVRQDLQGFGQLWSELVLGRRITALPSVDDRSDADWAALTRGFRVILWRSLGSRTAWGCQEAEDLAQALEEQKQQLELANEDSTAVLRKAESLHRKAMRSSDPGEKSRLADQVLTLIDLIPGGLMDNRRIEALESWGREQFSVVMGEAVEAIERIKGKLRLQDYETAAQMADETMGRFEGQGIGMRQASLRLTRWMLIAQAGVRGNELRRDMREPMNSLQECVLKVEEATYVKIGVNMAHVTLVLSSAQNALQKAVGNMPDEIKHTLQPLRLEIDVRGNIAAAIRMDGERRLDEARAWYAKALAMWKELERSNALYAEILRADLDLLDMQLSQKNLETTLADELKQRQDSFAEALQDLIASLQSDERGEWRNLASELTVARECYQRTRPLLSEPADSDLVSYEFVTWLSDVNDCMERGSVVCALERARQMPSPPILEEHKSIALCRCQNAALRGARQLLEKKWSWPDELAKALSIVTAVRASPSLSPEIEHQISGIEKDLQDWKENLNNFRRRLGLLDNDNQFANDFARVLSDLDNTVVDCVLQEVIHKWQIEIFDRTGLSDEEAARYRVQALLTIRRSARLVDQVNRLAEDLGKIGPVLKGEAGNLQGRLDQVDSALHQYQALSISLGEKNLELDLIGDQLDRFSATNKELERAHSQCPEIRRLAAEIAEQGQSLERNISSIDGIIIRAQGQARKLKQFNDDLEREMQRAQSLQGKPSKAYAPAYTSLEQEIEAVLKRRESEHYEAIAKQLEELKQRISDCPPDALPALEAALEKLRRMRDLSVLERDVLEECNRWYNERREFSKAAKSLREKLYRLSPQIGTSQISLDQLKAILEQANQLVMNAPANLPPLYWQELSRQLEQAYNYLATPQFPDYPELLVWLGILYFRVQRRGHPSVASSSLRDTSCRRTHSEKKGP